MPTREEQKKLLDNLAKILSGLQVPVSLGSGLLGADLTVAWSEAHDATAGFGWHDAAEYREGLRKMLEVPADDG